MTNEREQPKFIERFNVFQRFTHLLVITSFLTLALTGMALKFAIEPWAQTVAYVGGGFAVLGALHRLCAIVTFFYFFLTTIMLFTHWRDSKKSLLGFLFDPEGLMPNLNDLKEMAGTFKWFFGGPKPYYGRWVYWEKFDFFAVFWGIAVIGGSGLILWFPEMFTTFLPGWSINVATIIHSDEALLASGFIFTIHFYNTHLRPEKFPLDPVIFVGQITIDEMKHERPREYDQLVASGELDKMVSRRAPRGWLIKVSYLFGAFCVTTGSVLVVLIISTMYSYIFGR